LSNNSDSTPENTRFSTRAIRTAFENLAPSLGRSNVDALIYGLETFGLQLSNDDNSYSMKEIQHALNDLFSDAAPLILASLKKTLSSQADS